MPSLPVFAPGGYRYIPAVFQYSGGVAAEPGHVLERVTFARPLPLKDGFAAAKAIMAEAGSAPTAFASCELRSPAPFTESGFKAFNEIYVGTLAEWGIFDGNANPVARSNVCPELDKPAEPSLYAFCFTRKAPEGARPSFAVAGSGEAAEGKGTYRDNTIRLGDVSPDGIAEKARWVLAEMKRRMGLLGFDWPATTGVQVYTVHDFHHVIAGKGADIAAIRHGLVWHYCRPPVVDLEFEMDCRGLEVDRTFAS